jgi:chromosome segregation protein
MFEEAAGVLKYKKRKEEAIHKLDKTHNNMSRVKDIINELETQVEPLREQKIKALEYFDLQDEYKSLDISSIVYDIENLNTKYNDNKKRVEELKEELTNISISNNKYDIDIEKYKNDINKLNEEINTKQQEFIKMTSEVEKINSRKEIILERKKYEVDDTKLHNQVLELKEEKLKVENDVAALESIINSLSNKTNELNNNVLKEEKIINTIKNEKKKLEIELTGEVRNKNIIDNKIVNLRNSIDNSNSLPSSVRNILNNPKLKGIHSNIGSIIEVEEKYSKAISVALGPSSNYIIVDNENNAKECINYLKTNNMGRATFFPLNVIKGRDVDSITLNDLKKMNGFINVASSLVQNDKVYDNIISNQLGNVLIVDTLDNANKISKLINYKYRIVTLDGELLHVGGSITGGNIITKNVITEKYELESNIKFSEDIEKVIKNLENKLNEIDYNLQSEEDKLYLINKDLIVNNDELDSKRKNLNELKNKLESINNNITGTNNIISNNLSNEEDEVLNEYYEALKKKDDLNNTINNLKNKLAGLNQSLDEITYLSKKDNTIYNEKNNELKELEIEVNRSDVKLDNLLNILNESYSMTYEFAKKNYQLDMDYNLVKTKLSTIKHKMKELEPINATAPEEYDKVSVRYEFLIKQQEDLTKAENTLLEIISEMDEVMKKNFIHTFKIINDNFNQTFKELFKGGEASLKLTDPENVLETGIEIVASPPGKSLKSISLLSGGEKTFTAISLLFAILKSRPVPFCVLDEVEAALDEVNVESFGEYLQKLKDKTQFIIITHKKKTMEYADILYGITMQESGVSKLVSVKLEEIK